MKKYIKMLLFITVFFLSSTVEAASECYNMIGANNTTIIPNGYYAYCGEYELDLTSTTYTENGDYKPQIIHIAYEKNYLSILTDQDINTVFYAFDFRDTGILESEFGQGSWAGLKYDDSDMDNNLFDNVRVDSSIKGCPKTIYWSIDSSNRTEVGFCADSCTIGGNIHAKYVLKNNNEILYTKDGTNFKTASQIKSELNKCNPDNTENNDSEGESGFIDNSVDSIFTTELKRCKYYFEFENYAGEDCIVTDIELIYNKIEKAGITTYEVTTGYQGMDLSFIQRSLDEMKSNDTSTFSKASDYLIYKNGTWSCPNKMYIIRNTGEDMPILGATDYTKHRGYGTSSAEENHISIDNLCPTSTPETDINWGDRVSVNCDGIIGKELLDFINKIFRWIQILAPIFVIIMGSVDFAGALLQDDRDALKKASNKFIKRLIIAVALFFIPIILSFVLEVFNGVTGAYSSTCGIGGK